MIRLVVKKIKLSFKVILEQKVVIKIMQLQNITVKSDYIRVKQLWDRRSCAVYVPNDCVSIERNRLGATVSVRQRGNRH